MNVFHSVCQDASLRLLLCLLLSFPVAADEGRYTEEI